VVEKRVDRFDREALARIRQEALALGHVCFSLLWIGSGVVCLIHSCTLDVVILSLVGSILRAGVVPVALVGVPLIRIALGTGPCFVIEPVGPALTPGVVSMARKGAWIRILDSGTIAVSTAVASVPGVALIAIAAISGLAVVSVAIASTLLSIMVLAPVVTSSAGLVSFWLLVPWDKGVLRGLPVHTRILVAVVGPRNHSHHLEHWEVL